MSQKMRQKQNTTGITAESSGTSGVNTSPASSDIDINLPFSTHRKTTIFYLNWNREESECSVKDTEIWGTLEFWETFWGSMPPAGTNTAFWDPPMTGTGQIQALFVRLIPSLSSRCVSKRVAIMPTILLQLVLTKQYIIVQCFWNGSVNGPTR